MLSDAIRWLRDDAMPGKQYDRARKAEALTLVELGVSAQEAPAALADAPKTALKHLSQLTVLAGVGTDKIQRDRDPRHQLQLHSSGPVCIIINSSEPHDVIEGETAPSVCDDSPVTETGAITHD